MKKIISLCLVAVMLLSAMIVGVAAEPTVSVWNGTDVSTTLSGAGTEEDPWLIQSAADLKYFADSVNANHNSTGGKTYAGEFVKLTVDVDLAGHKWTPIGWREKAVFQGTFDGDGHTISGFSNWENPTFSDANPASGDGVYYRNGFFGGLGTVKSHQNTPAAATTDTTIKNFTLKGSVNYYTETAHSVANGAAFVSAALVGHINQDNYTGTTKVYVTNITVDVDVKATGFGSGAIMGGAVGLANGAVFTNVVNNGDLTVNANKSAYTPTGALVGRAEGCTFTNCVNNGNVSYTTAKNDNQVRVGGLVGQMYKKQLDHYLTFENCVNNGNVTAESTHGEAGIVVAGGILGAVYYNTSTSTWTDGTTQWRDYKVTLTNCANTGTITTKVPASVTGKTSTGGLVGSTYMGANGAANNGGGFTLTGCANTGKIVGADEGRACDLIGCVYTDKAANYNIVVKNCVASEAITSSICNIKDWKTAYKGTTADAKAAAKRVRAIVSGNTNTGDNTTLVVAMVAVLALGTAFVVSKKVAVRAR